MPRARIARVTTPVPGPSSSTGRHARIDLAGDGPASAGLDGKNGADILGPRDQRPKKPQIVGKFGQGAVLLGMAAA